jgi:hypothetical protein
VFAKQKAQQGLRTVTTQQARLHAERLPHDEMQTNLSRAHSSIDSISPTKEYLL